jgi:hypothetical protein
MGGDFNGYCNSTYQNQYAINMLGYDVVNNITVPMLGFNNIVRSLLVVGSKLFAAGNFTSTRSPSSLTTSEQRICVMDLSTTTNGLLNIKNGSTTLFTTGEFGVLSPVYFYANNTWNLSA